MKILSSIKENKLLFLSITLLCLYLTCCASNLYAWVSEFSPSLYISEDYTDNYYQTDLDRDYEFYTTYGIDLSFGLFDKTSQMIVSYNPEFKDYEKHNDNDALEHNASFDGRFNPSQRSALNLNMNYDGHEGNVETESWEHSASLDSSYKLTKYTDTSMSANYSKSYDRQLRTGTWNESKDYSVSGGASHKFGRKDSIGFDYTYSITDYIGDDSDDYEEHTPSMFMAYWFTPKLGFDSNLSYEYTVYDLSEEDSKTWSGDLRLLRALTKHFYLYTKYEHTYTKEEEQEHTVYTPSVGFEWSPTDDSGVTLGIGYMIQEWENNDTNKSIFIDADIFKTFNFAKHGAFTVSAASGYDATSEEAASLGFQIYYEAGFLLSYQFLKECSAELTGAYVRDEFDDPDVDRADDTITLEASLSWSPWEKVKIDLIYTFEDYKSDDESVEEFYENRGTIMFTLYPKGLPRMLSKSTGAKSDIERSSRESKNREIGGSASAVDRSEIEDKIFNNSSRSSNNFIQNSTTER